MATLFIKILFKLHTTLFIKHYYTSCSVIQIETGMFIDNGEYC